VRPVHHSMPQEPWCRLTVVGPDKAELASGVLEGPGAPDLGAVDDVARLALVAKRLGGALVLADVVPALQVLLELAGLPVQVQGKSEGGKEPFGIEQRQEECHPDDLSL
jgi:hypothetical protein